ncbi:MAG: chorismate lyase [Burkholderiaceae bacterium]|nr:chorismate lyase [Burkholderiaceae bacterium]
MLQRKSRSPSCWQVIENGAPLGAPLFLQDWLSDTGSLTRKLESTLRYKQDEHLELRILADCRQNLVSSEKSFFRRPLSRSRIREVVLCDQGEPIIVARSVLPISSSIGTNHRILKLGHKPLGAVLFAKDLRGRFRPVREIVRLDHHHPEWKACQKRFKDLPKRVWARRTLYQLNGHPLLVMEIFLPALQAKLKQLGQ